MMPSSLWRNAVRGAAGLLAALFVVAATASVVRAQDPPADPPAPKVDPPKADVTKAPAKGGGGAIGHIFSSVGWFWLILAPISLVLLILVVILVLDLRGSASIPAGFVDEFTDIVNRRRFKEAFDMARDDSSYLGRVLTAGMGRLQYGLEDAREAALNTLDGIKSSKDSWNNYTAVIATLGPLLGLVGTVFGMILAFKVLSEGQNANPAALADSISHALSVTLVGVAIAVPAIAVNTFFRNRITQVMLSVGAVADDLLTQMYHNSKKPGGGGPAPAPAPVAGGGQVAAAPVQAAPVQAAPVAPR